MATRQRNLFWPEDPVGAAVPVPLLGMRGVAPGSVVRSSLGAPSLAPLSTEACMLAEDAAVLGISEGSFALF